MTDPFSDVLAALGTRGARATYLETSGDWALSFDGRGRIKFVVPISGECWLLLPGRRPERLRTGDLALLADTLYAVASHPDRLPTDGMALYEGCDGVRLGEGNDTMLIGGGTALADGSAASFVLEALPSCLRIDGGSEAGAAIQRTLRAMQAEVARGGVGSAAVAERLAEILVVEAVRAYVDAAPADGAGWIGALGDPKIATAIGLLHADVARRWTALDLARAVGMSRSAFAERFTRRVGHPPLDYLARWRMVLAARRLEAGGSVAAVAAEVGYGSQSAFAHAFRRRTGRTPRAVSKGAATASQTFPVKVSSSE